MSSGVSGMGGPLTAPPNPDSRSISRSASSKPSHTPAFSAKRMNGALQRGVRFSKNRGWSGTGLLQDRSKLHRQPHIAGNAQFALHEGGGTVELATHHPLEGIETYADRRIRALASAVRHRVGRGFAVNKYAPRLAEIELQGASKARIAT